MNKIIIALVIAFTYSTYPQLINNFGVKLGGSAIELNWDHFDNDNYIGSHTTPYSKIGFNFGIFTELLNHQNFNIVTELNYVHEISQQELSFPDYDAVIANHNIWKLTLDYINISLLAKPKYELGLFTPYLLLGPSLDIETNRKLENDQPVSNALFIKNRFGLKLGFGSEVKIAPYIFFTELIYQISLTDLYKEEYLTLDTRNLNFRFGIKL